MATELPGRLPVYDDIVDEAEVTSAQRALFVAAAFVPRGGAVRYPDGDEGGAWVQANPGDAMYSTALMMATHFWCERRGWVDIISKSHPAANSP